MKALGMEAHSFEPSSLNINIDSKDLVLWLQELQCNDIVQIKLNVKCSCDQSLSGDESHFNFAHYLNKWIVLNLTPVQNNTTLYGRLPKTKFNDLVQVGELADVTCR